MIEREYDLRLGENEITVLVRGRFMRGCPATRFEDGYDDHFEISAVVYAGVHITKWLSDETNRCIEEYCLLSLLESK
jgi:hypothetical protein